MQIAINTVVSASIVLLIAVGFSIVFSTTRFFHFAHGIVFTCGAYIAYACHESLRVPLGGAVILGAGGACLVGCVIEWLVYRPLRRRGGSGLVLLLASLGVYVVLENGVSLIFGDATRVLRWGSVAEGVNVLGGRVTPAQIAAVAVAGGLVASLWVLMKATRVGTALRAVASNPELAGITGIEANPVILLAFGLGSFLAGVAGAASAMLSDMTPTMGMTPLMLAVVAVIIGGVGSLPGLICATVVICLAQQLTGWHLGAQWQDAVVFALLVVFLLCRPQGMLGRRIGKAAV